MKDISESSFFLFVCFCSSCTHYAERKSLWFVVCSVSCGTRVKLSHQKGTECKCLTVDVILCTFVEGVLRGVDMARGLYFLVTPVPPATLRQVNCLLLGEITLPKVLLTVQVKKKKHKAFTESCEALTLLIITVNLGRFWKIRNNGRFKSNDEQTTSSYYCIRVAHLVKRL